MSVCSAEVSEVRNGQKRVENKRTQRFAVAPRRQGAKHSCRLKTLELLGFLLGLQAFIAQSVDKKDSIARTLDFVISQFPQICN